MLQTILIFTIAKYIKIIFDSLNNNNFGKLKIFRRNKILN